MENNLFLQSLILESLILISFLSFVIFYKYYTKSLTTITLIKYSVLPFFLICFILGLSIIFSITYDSFNPSLIVNFKRAFNDVKLREALINTFRLFVLSLVFQLGLCLLTTIFIKRIPKFLFGFLFIPFALGVVAPAFSLFLLFTTIIGPFVIGVFGNPIGEIATVVFIDSWQWSGILLIAFYGSLNSIPKSYYEQAKLEGISLFNQWRHIIFPEIIGIIGFYTIVRLIDWVRKVELIEALFGDGGSGYYVETISKYIVLNYYAAQSRGYASFLSLIQLLVLTVIVLIFINFPFTKRFSNYNEQ